MSQDIKSFFVSIRNFLTGSFIWLLVLSGACILFIDKSALDASMPAKMIASAPPQVVTQSTNSLPMAVVEEETADSSVVEPAQQDVVISPQIEAEAKPELPETQAVVKLESEPATQPAEESIPKSKEPELIAALSNKISETITKPATVGQKGDWYIQIGVFSSNDNAEQLTARAKLNGWDVKTHTVVDGARLITKLLVGPYSSKESANSVISDVSEDLKLKDPYVTQANL